MKELLPPIVSGGRTYPIALPRHSAFHTMDHAWEMEDKDLSG